MAPNTAELLPTFRGIRTAFPAHRFTQEEIFDTFYRELYADIPQAEKLFASTRVKQRYFAWDPRQAFAEGSPPTSKRMEIWEGLVHELGMEALEALLEGVDRERIGSFVMASCTGYAGPTPEMMLARSLGLRSDLRRTLVGHMGCYAAFNALKVGIDALAARPQDHVLIDCTELCMLHIRPEVSKEQAVIHALFGDACACTLLQAEAPGAGTQILRTHTETYYESYEAMTWKVLDHGFRMHLSPLVPLILGRVVKDFVDRLLEPAGLTRADISRWGIHPGGPSIVESVARSLEVSDDELRATWSVLENYGNCSSGTILLVLEEMLRNDTPAPGEYGVFMAFGPGLTAEGMLLRFGPS